MCNYAVEFMLAGVRVGRRYVLARSPYHAIRVASRHNEVEEYDDVTATPL